MMPVICTQLILHRFKIEYPQILLFKRDAERHEGGHGGPPGKLFW
jgi:hypothetical protein